MNQELKAVLIDITKLGQAFVKAGNEIIMREFGDDIQKIASETTDAMIEAGIADAGKRDAIVGVADSTPKEGAIQETSEEVWERNWNFIK